MKKIILFILLSVLLIGCSTSRFENLTTITSGVQSENIQKLLNNQELKVYQKLEKQQLKNFNIKYVNSFFALSQNANLEMFQETIVNRNGYTEPKKMSYFLKVDGKFQVINQNMTTYDGILHWSNLLKMDVLLSQLMKNANQIQLVYLKDFLDESSLSDEFLLGNNVSVQYEIKAGQIEKIIFDLTQIFKISNYRFEISFLNQKSEIIMPEGVIGDDYKITDEIKAYPHLSENPSEVLVKHIDIGKYDKRDEFNPNAVLDQDKGESTYIKIGKIDILIDGSQNNNQEKSYTAIKETFNQNSEDQILEYVILTHPHADHFGGLLRVFRDFQVKYILESSSKYSSYSFKAYESMRNIQVKNGATLCTAKEALENSNNACKKRLNLAPNVSITLLKTGFIESTEANPSSLVLLLNALGTKYLFTGDAEKDQEAIYSPSVGKIDILKMPHHGTKNATEINLLSNCNPSNIIVQNGNNLGNQYGHPTSASINRIYKYNNEINIYPLTGGGFGESCTYRSGKEKTCSYVPENSANNFSSTFDPNRFIERNGTITTRITSDGYKITSELMTIIEMSQTRYWKEHLNRSFSHK